MGIFNGHFLQNITKPVGPPAPSAAHPCPFSVLPFSLLKNGEVCIPKHCGRTKDHVQETSLWKWEYFCGIFVV